MIYYTMHEGGSLYELRVKSMRQKIVRKLNKHRKKTTYRYFGKYVSSLSEIKSYSVQSVFFCKGEKVVRIWDAFLNGYRSKKFTKGLTIPKKHRNKYF